PLPESTLDHPGGDREPGDIRPGSGHVLERWQGVACLVGLDKAAQQRPTRVALLLQPVGVNEPAGVVRRMGDDAGEEAQLLGRLAGPLDGNRVCCHSLALMPAWRRTAYSTVGCPAPGRLTRWLTVR